ncbi:sensor histidine kinase [Microvirga arabica]|uniref:histidine kinase n=1 Tax=Microvirga arabica TaxID=1128671 RepID=A0ABV6YE54_9HYPH
MSKNSEGVQPIAPEQGGDAAEELAYRLRQQELTTQFSLFALKSTDLNQILQEAVRVSAQGLHSELSKIVEFLPDEQRFIVRAGVGWKPSVVNEAHMGADAENPAGFAFQTGRPVISNHLAGESRFRTPQLLVDHGVKRAINVIIQGEDEPYGVLEVDSTNQGRFTEADIAFLQGVANVLGVAIERQRILENQEVLTREINHRVKNSLQLVASLLNMQARGSQDVSLQQALSDAETRVHTIARVHDRLWRSNEVSFVDLGEFLAELCATLQQTAPHHIVTCDVEPVVVTTDRAIALGLMVNELVTNAAKYAYPQGSGDILIKLSTPTAKQVRLEVSDRGAGLPSNLDPSRSRSLGMRLVSSLTRQLGGQTEWQDAQPGTRVVLELSTE